MNFRHTKIHQCRKHATTTTTSKYTQARPISDIYIDVDEQPNVSTKLVGQAGDAMVSTCTHAHAFTGI
jgi:hypothetical protein